MNIIGLGIDRLRREKSTVMLGDFASGPLNPIRVRLTDRVSETVIQSLKSAPTKAEMEQGESQFRLWAQSGTTVMFANGNKINELVFAGQLDGPQEDGSFFVKGTQAANPEGQLWRLGGRIALQGSERVDVNREESSISVFLQC